MCLRTLPFGLSLSGYKFEEDQKTSTLSDLSRNNKSPGACVLPLCSRRVLGHLMWYVIVIVAMFVMTKTFTMETLMKVTMSMKTMITTVQHRIHRIVWSCFPFSTLQFVCIQGACLLCRCILLGRVVRPCSRHVLKKKRRNSYFHFAIMSNSSMSNCVVLEVALHDRSAITLSSRNSSNRR